MWERKELRYRNKTHKQYLGIVVKKLSHGPY